MSEQAGRPRKLFLDDFRNPPDSTWDIVRSFDAFCAYITEHGLPYIISFDHDLGYVSPDGDTMLGLNGEPIDPATWKEKNGYDCAKWLVENHGVPALWYVHSMNPVGAQRIKQLLEQERS